MSRTDSSGRYHERVETWRQDANPECDHDLNPDTVEIISRTEQGCEIEGKCLHCEHVLYEPISVEEMCAYEQGDL